jgi:nucleotide-binding universal stress UspA family protein
MKAIIGTDASACAQVAVDLVAGLPWPEGSTLRIVSVLDVLGFYGPFIGWSSDVAELEADLDHTLHAKGAEYAERLAAPGRTVEQQVLSGRPSTVLCDEAHSLGADLIVVGSRGHGPISSMLLGSVSAEVVDHAARPVLVARGRHIERVLLATDGSDHAFTAETLLRTWPIFSGARVDVISVAPPEHDWDGSLRMRLTGCSPPGIPRKPSCRSAMPPTRSRAWRSSTAPT